MGAFLVPGLVSTLIGLIPACWLQLLDAWSHRRAQRRAARRRELWRMKSGSAPATPPARID